MTRQEIEEGTRILNRVCLHYLQNIDLYDKDARMTVILALARLHEEPSTATVPVKLPVSVSYNQGGM